MFNKTYLKIALITMFLCTSVGSIFAGESISTENEQSTLKYEAVIDDLGEDVQKVILGEQANSFHFGVMTSTAEDATNFIETYLATNEGVAVLQSKLTNANFLTRFNQDNKAELTTQSFETLREALESSYSFATICGNVVATAEIDSNTKIILSSNTSSSENEVNCLLQRSTISDCNGPCYIDKYVFVSSVGAMTAANNPGSGQLVRRKIRFQGTCALFNISDPSQQVDPSNPDSNVCICDKN